MPRTVRYSKDSLLKAKQMRQEPSKAEKILWKELRRGQLQGIRFRRQQPIGPFIADFYCSELGVVVELDGETHGGREEYDQSRQRWMEEKGLKVIRFTNAEIYENLQGVLQVLQNMSAAGEARKSPPPCEGEG